MTSDSKLFDSFEAAGVSCVNTKRNNQKLQCPRCQDTRKNKRDRPLWLSAQKGTWKCFHCDWTGGIKNPQFVAEKKKDYVRPGSVELNLSDDIIKYFGGRGIEPRVLEYFKIGETSVNGQKWIGFPFYRDKELINIKKRPTTHKDFRMIADAELIFFNLDCIEGRNDCIITEGEIDAMSLYQCGFFGAVSVPNGANTGQMEYLDNCYDYFQDLDRIVLCVDNDEKGQELREELARRLGRGKCWFVNYPEGCKDANEVLTKYGEQAVKDMIKSAYPHPVDNINTPGDYLAEVMDYYENGFPKGDMIGFSGFDELASFRPGELVIITGWPNNGKALALDTPIPTPEGWTTMGEIKTGDTIFDEQGNPCKVLGVTETMHGRDCYEVSFAAGEKIVCDANHNWFTRDNKARKSLATAISNDRLEGRVLKPKGTDQTKLRSYPSVKTTEEIANTLFVHKDKRINHAVPVTGPLVTSQKDLPIPPYTLGAWLGDGSSASGGFTSADPEIIEFIRQDGFEVRKQSRGFGYGIIKIAARLNEIGLINNKHIPTEYLRGDIQQRTELLMGLMDTDGCIGNYGDCEFTSTNQNLADGVYELAASLGFIPSIAESMATLYGKDCGRKWRVIFTPKSVVFKLSRKADKQKANIEKSRDGKKWRGIVGCDRVKSVPVRCIQVDSASHLYLCGKAMIPTHNSNFLDQILVRLSTRHNWKHAVISREQWPHSIHTTKLVQIISSHNLRSRDMSPAIIKKSISYLNDHFFLYGIKDMTLDGILETAKQLVIQHGIKSLTIDPWSTIAPPPGSKLSKLEYTNEALRKICDFKDMYGVMVFVVAHPQKLATDPKTGKRPMCELTHISGSQDFENFADVGISVYRNKGTRADKIDPLGDTVTAHVVKMRNFFNGTQGAQTFDYNYRAGTYAEEFTPFECELDRVSRGEETVQANIPLPTTNPPKPREVGELTPFYSLPLAEAPF